MLITSGISIILSCLLSFTYFLPSLSINFILSTHQFSIDDLPFVVAVEKDNTTESLSKKSDKTGKVKQASKNKSEKKQWKFTESPKLPQNQVKQGYMSEMKSRLEQSSSAVQGTSENATMLKVYLNQQGN